MAVPEDIRSVPRPVNTIVDDSGTDDPKKYAIRERCSFKYIQGGNPQPRNGKVIGHIIDHLYVPLNAATAPAGPDMLSYGASASALVKSVTSDLFRVLLAVYPANEAYSIMSIATLKVVKLSAHYCGTDVGPLQPDVCLQGLSESFPVTEHYLQAAPEDRAGWHKEEAVLSAPSFPDCCGPPYRGRWDAEAGYKYCQ